MRVTYIADDWPSVIDHFEKKAAHYRERANSRADTYKSRKENNEPMLGLTLRDVASGYSEAMAWEQAADDLKRLRFRTPQIDVPS